MKGVFYIGILLVEYISGFTIFLGACKTIDRIFRYPIKKYTVSSVFFALVHIAVVFVSLQTGYGVIIELTVIMYILIIWLFFTDKSLKSLLVSLTATIFSASVCYGASTVSTLADNLFGMDNITALTSDNFYIGILCNMIGYVAALVYIMFLSFIGKGKSEEQMSVWNMLALMLAAYLSSQFMFNIYYNENNYGRYQTIMLGYIGISAAVVLSAKSSESKFYSRISKINENYLNAQKKYYDSRQKSDTEIRRIKHDMKNHMICIKELCKKGKYEELEEYISGITDMLNESDKSIHVGNDIADAIINDKFSKAEKKGITLTVSGTLDTDYFAPIDVCTILSNLLDNAIEATEILNEDMRKIDISFKKNRHFILITVLNPSDVFVNTSHTDKLDKANHGFGIANVRRAVEKYGGEVSFNCTEEGEGYLFTAEAFLTREDSCFNS